MGFHNFKFRILQKNCQFSKIFTKQAKRCSVIKHRVGYSAKKFTNSSIYDVTKVRNVGLLMIRSQTD